MLDGAQWFLAFCPVHNILLQQQIDFVHNFLAIPAATRIPFDELKQGFQKLQVQFRLSLKSFEAIQQSTPTSSPVIPKLASFFEKATPEIQRLEDSVAESEKEFNLLLSYFGVADNKRSEYTPPLFFGLIIAVWGAFLSSFSFFFFPFCCQIFFFFFFCVHN